MNDDEYDSQENEIIIDKSKITIDNSSNIK
jgi:hypothetical protein